MWLLLSEEYFWGHVLRRQGEQRSNPENPAGSATETSDKVKAYAHVPAAAAFCIFCVDIWRVVRGDLVSTYGPLLCSRLWERIGCTLHPTPKQERRAAPLMVTKFETRQQAERPKGGCADVLTRFDPSRMR